ncbi:MAG: pilus assembly protein [Alphaproteobacteria bacterium]|nr:pilus assembly protein [Alphaproteobacteria bacterium]
MMMVMQDISRKVLKPFVADNNGSATIEFVVTLPLTLVAFVFAFEFSQLFLAHHVATNNVRSATRYLSRAPLVEPYLTGTRNIARTGDLDTATGAYDWMAAIQDSDIDIQTNHETFTNTDFRVTGQVVRIQMDVPYTFTTFGMLNGFTGGSIGNGLTLNIIEEARYIGE